MFLYRVQITAGKILGVGKRRKVESNTIHRVFLDFLGNDRLLWRGKLKKQLEVVTPAVSIESSQEE